jgi:hypothetical protein
LEVQPRPARALAEAAATFSLPSAKAPARSVDELQWRADEPGVSVEMPGAAAARRVLGLVDEPYSAAVPVEARLRLATEKVAALLESPPLVLHRSKEGSRPVAAAEGALPESGSNSAKAARHSRWRKAAAQGRALRDAAVDSMANDWAG